jgi:hypothetical protein
MPLMGVHSCLMFSISPNNAVSFFILKSDCKKYPNRQFEPHRDVVHVCILHSSDTLTDFPYRSPNLSIHISHIALFYDYKIMFIGKYVVKTLMVSILYCKKLTKLLTNIINFIFLYTWASYKLGQEITTNIYFSCSEISGTFLCFFGWG